MGQLYVIQNFGNVILQLENFKEQTEVTSALRAKGLCDVIVCGHLNCRTVGHFLMKDRDNEWLKHGDRLGDFIESQYGNIDDPSQLNVAAQENVLLQSEKEMVSLSTSGVKARLYGWMTDTRSNRIYYFDPRAGRFRN